MAGNPRDWAPPPGTSWWDEDDKAYDRAVRRQQKERGVPFWRRSRRRPLWTWALIPIALLGFLTAAAVAVGSADDDGDAVSLRTPTSMSAPASTAPATPPTEPAVPPSTGIPESVSRNTTNPPQSDLNGDTECVIGTIDWVTARGTLTNHSSETSSYMVHVSFNDEAGIRFAEAPTFHNDVRPGETVRWEAFAPQRAPAGPWTCEVA